MAPGRFGMARMMRALAPQAFAKDCVLVPAAIERISAPESANAFSRTASLRRICGLMATTQTPTADASTSSMPA